MRQFFTVRFWIALLALGGMALGALVLLKSTRATSHPADTVPGKNSDRIVDLVSWVYAAVPAQGFEMLDGKASADLALQLDGTRTMVVKAGTPGEITCPDLTKVATCTVAADLLGDAVLWFSLVPGPPGKTVELPAVTELMKGNLVRLANDWVLHRASVVQRVCPDDTSSLTDFVNRFGKSATSTFSFDQQRIITVTCPGGAVGTTTTTVPGTGVPGSGPETVPGTQEPG